jgi:UrcA family protein
MKSIKLVLSVAAVTLSGLASATAPASVASDVPSVVVQYGDLSLATKAGIKTLHARLRTAAETVCASLDSRILGLREQYDHCVRDAIAQGVARVGNENLTNYHRYRRSPQVVASN